MIKPSKCVQLIFLWISIPSIVMTATIYGNPWTRTFNENDDSASDMWTVSATCYPSANNYVLGIFTGTTSHTVSCETCTWNDPNSDLFQYSGDVISKKACTDSDCGDCQSCTACSTANGCLSGPTSYSITVTCSTTSYDNNDSGSSTLTVSVTEEESSSTLAIDLPASVSADNSMSVNDVIATARQLSGPAIVQYRKSSAVAASHILNTADLFDFNPANGEVYIRTDPSAEYDNTYSMGICIYSRRQTSCATLTINFDGCYQTPYCDDQTDNSFSDQIAVGTTLFTMTANAGPTAHFAAFDSTWRNLNYVITSSTLSEATIDAATGVITTTGNVTVWPDYPYSSHTIVVEVNNSGLTHSCSYTSSCTLSSQFSFTNWPIRFENLPTKRIHHEDIDARTLKLTIITFDYNNPAHDNVTCREAGNEEPTLLELVHTDGNFDYNSWSIYKKICQDAGCGYIEESFLCDEGIGCLNYDLDDEYTIDINCSDAYGSSVEARFTLQVTENQPPIFTNTPTSVKFYSNKAEQHDVVFSIYYSDAENETLEYNFTITPSTPPLFAFDTRGNYQDDPANVTVALSEWNVSTKTFDVDFCGRERRNIICSSFEIDVKKLCGPTPVCTDSSTTVTDQTPIFTELFQINVTGSGYTSLYYVIITGNPKLFSVDSATGSVITTAALEVISPPDSTTYSIVANVYDAAACAIGVCSLSVLVTFINHPLTFVNLPASFTIDEDTDIRTLLHRISFFDQNNPVHDKVTCTDVSNDDSTLIELSHDGNFSQDSWFIYKKTCLDTGCGYVQDHFLCSKGIGCMNYDLENEYNITIQCSDAFGSSDMATFTLLVAENQPPVFSNLPDTVSINKAEVVNLGIVFTISYTDEENEDLLYNFTVTPSISSLFALDSRGNFANDSAKIMFTNETSESDIVSGIYVVELCGSDRRNIICSSLKINMTEPAYVDETVEELFPIIWLVFGLALAVIIVIIMALIVRNRMLTTKLRSSEETRNERNANNNIQGLQHNDRPNSYEETEFGSGDRGNQYESIQANIDTDNMFEGRTQYALPQDVDVEVRREENEQGEHIDDYLHPISRSAVTGESRNERDDSNNILGSQHNDRLNSYEETEFWSGNQYESIPANIDTELMYEGRTQYALPQDVDVEVRREENEQGVHIDDYLQPISSSGVTESTNSRNSNE